MSNSPHIIYTPRADTSAETEAAVLSCAYRYIMRCYEEKQAAEAAEASEDADDGGESP